MLRRKPKKYKVTKKVAYAFIKQEAAERLVEKYIEHEDHSRAVEMQERSEELRMKAWGLVYELHPSLRPHPLTYWRHSQCVVKTAEANQ